MKVPDIPVEPFSPVVSTANIFSAIYRQQEKIINIFGKAGIDYNRIANELDVLLKSQKESVVLGAIKCCIEILAPNRQVSTTNITQINLEQIQAERQKAKTSLSQMSKKEIEVLAKQYGIEITNYSENKGKTKIA